MKEHELIEAALSVRHNAYAPYSKFKVGAALVSKNGDLFTGCNVENSSYGLAICAERHAVGAMVAAGIREFDKIVVAASPLASPCGACRQFIIEFGDGIEVVAVDAENPKSISRWNIKDLLPNHFHFDQIRDHS